MKEKTRLPNTGNYKFRPADKWRYGKLLTREKIFRLRRAKLIPLSRVPLAPIGTEKPLTKKPYPSPKVAKARRKMEKNSQRQNRRYARL